MDFRASTFKQSKIVIAIVSAVASIYVFQVSIMLLQPVLLFAALLICLVCMLEAFLDYRTNLIVKGLYAFATLLAGFGFWLSYEMIEHSGRIVEYLPFLH